MPTTDINKLSAAELARLAKEARAKERAQADAKRREYDRLRDEYLETCFGKMAELSATLKEFKDHAVKLGLELHEKMYLAYDREPKEGIDSYTLTSSDGLRKVVIERQWRCEYDETSIMAIETIRQVLRDKFEGRNKGMYKIIDSILMRNTKGDYDERLVAKLRKHEEDVSDPRFSEALDLLAKSYRPTSSQTYIRAYRKDEQGRWQDITMNWSRM